MTTTKEQVEEAIDIITPNNGWVGYPKGPLVVDALTKMVDWTEGGAGGGAVRSFLIDSGQEEDVSKSKYATFDAGFAAARAWVDAGSRAEFIWDSGAPSGVTYDFTGIRLVGSDPGKFFIVGNENTVFSGLTQMHNITVYGDGAQAGRTTPMFGAGSSNLTIEISGYRGGFYGTSSYAGAVPLFRSQSSGIFRVRLLGASHIIGLQTGNQIELSGSGQFDVIDRSHLSTLELPVVTGTGSLFRLQGFGSTIIGGAATAGVGGANGFVHLNASSAPSRFGHYVDATKVATPQTFTDGARTKITVDGAGIGGNTAYDPFGYWDTATSKVAPDVIGACFIIRLNLTVEQLSAGNHEIIIDLDIGGSVGIISSTTQSSTVSGQVQKFSFVFPVYALDTFKANGGEFYMTARGSNFEVSEAAVQIIRAA